MHTFTATTEKRYIVAHNGNDVVHYAIVEPGRELSTGQPYVREHESEEELAQSVNELKGVDNYYEANKYGELYLLADVNQRYLKPVFDHQDGEELEDAPFDITTHHLFRFDKNIGAWVEGEIDEEGNWQLKEKK